MNILKTMAVAGNPSLVMLQKRLKGCLSGSEKILLVLAETNEALVLVGAIADEIEFDDIGIALSVSQRAFEWWKFSSLVGQEC